MASVNLVVIAGNLTRDVETRTLNGGQTVGEFGMAINDSYTDKAGTKVERAVFVDVVAWRKTADLCAKYLRNGSPALVEGQLQLDEWEDKQTGQKRSRLKVRASRVQFLGGRADRLAAQSPAAAPAGSSGSGAGPDDAIPFAPAP